jgi:hypothetical protein
MFRAIAQGLARNRGMTLLASDEAREADVLRQAVHDALCRGEVDKTYRPAVKSAVIDAPLPQYCVKLLDPKFWGGEPELLCLSRMLRTPLFVYLPNDSDGYAPLAKYGTEWLKPTGKKKRSRRPIRLLYVNGNHYDLLLV